MNDMDMFFRMLDGDFEKKESENADFYEEALNTAKQMFQFKKAFVEAGFTSQEAFELVKSSMEAAIR